MSREDFSRRVLEEQIFNELKDTIIKSARYLRAKYEGSDVNVSRLYRRIVNYQIKEYGGTLINCVPPKNREDLLKLNQKARARRYYRRNR